MLIISCAKTDPGVVTKVPREVKTMDLTGILFLDQPRERLM
jgi:hypothetical protein